MAKFGSILARNGNIRILPKSTLKPVWPFRTITSYKISEKSNEQGKHVAHTTNKQTDKHDSYRPINYIVEFPELEF